jgi:hypothetical protein
VVSPDLSIPKDTIATIHEKGNLVPKAEGVALLHHSDHGKFRKKLGRKIALADAVPQMDWAAAQRKEFWEQMMPWVRE